MKTLVDMAFIDGTESFAINKITNCRTQCNFAETNACWIRTEK